jgi:hypothetical protein
MKFLTDRLNEAQRVDPSVPKDRAAKERKLLLQYDAPPQKDDYGDRYDKVVVLHKSTGGFEFPEEAAIFFCGLGKQINAGLTERHQ